MRLGEDVNSVYPPAVYRRLVVHQKSVTLLAWIMGRKVFKASLAALSSSRLGEHGTRERQNI